MKKLLAVILTAAVLPAFAPAAQAQNLDDIFRRVSPSVVVVRSKGRDVSAGGVTARFRNVVAADPRSLARPLKQRLLGP